MTGCPSRFRSSADHSPIIRWPLWHHFWNRNETCPPRRPTKLSCARIPETTVCGVSLLASCVWELAGRRRWARSAALTVELGVVQLRQWVQAKEGRVVFSEQQFFVVQRLPVAGRSSKNACARQ